MFQRIGDLIHLGDLFRDRIPGGGVVDEQQPRLLTAQIVQAIPQPAEQQRRGKFPFLKAQCVAMDAVQRPDRAQKGYYQDDRDREERGCEPGS